MKTVQLQSRMVYGPVDSRRFGKSLGINILPIDRRTCSFDCIYCQYTAGIGNEHFPGFGDIYAQLSSDFERIRDMGTEIDWLMLSGNGEPTLHPQFPEIVDGLTTLRNLFFPNKPLGILSNSSTCQKKEIHIALSKLDGRFMKLDAGNRYLCQYINRPIAKLDWDSMLVGLRDLQDTTIQSMFVTGNIKNISERDIKNWIEAISFIRPIKVQIYTVDRTTQEQGILPVGKDKLQHIADQLQSYASIPAKVY